MFIDNTPIKVQVPPKDLGVELVPSSSKLSFTLSLSSIREVSREDSNIYSLNLTNTNFTMEVLLLSLPLFSILFVDFVLQETPVNHNYTLNKQWTLNTTLENSAILSLVVSFLNRRRWVVGSERAMSGRKREEKCRNDTGLIYLGMAVPRR